ncbi:MAG: hypothetical protein H0Z26_03535, partial [Candidatus Nitrotoga sp.]|nr:hypothetical protein [Candidatus Nitrotoga sp.]
SGSGSQQPQVEINNVRAIPTGTMSRKLGLTPVKSGKISIYVKEAGADSDYEVNITKTNKGTIEAGGVVIDAVAGVRLTLDIELNDNFAGALKVVAHEI